MPSCALFVNVAVSSTGGGVCPCISASAGVDVSFLGKLSEDKWKLFAALENFAKSSDDADDVVDDLAVFLALGAAGDPVGILFIGEGDGHL